MTYNQKVPAGLNVNNASFWVSIESFGGANEMFGLYIYCEGFRLYNKFYRNHKMWMFLSSIAPKEWKFGYRSFLLLCSYLTCTQYDELPKESLWWCGNKIMKTALTIFPKEVFKSYLSDVKLSLGIQVLGGILSSRLVRNR